MRKDMASYAAEMIGTAALVFFAAGAVMVSAMHGALPGPLVAGAASGLILMVVIWSLGEISGAHVNPAFTLALALTRRFPWRLVPGYIAAQLTGSAAGAAFLYLALGDHGAMGANLPNAALGVTSGPAFVIEIWLSFVMMVVILGAVSAQGRLKDLAAIPIGAIVGIEVMLMGPVAGAAMNPARAFGPYLFDGQWSFYWIYALGPLLGICMGILAMGFLCPRFGREA
jgi:aquaporin NIP